jgi:hypothetical protein
MLEKGRNRAETSKTHSHGGMKDVKDVAGISRNTKIEVMTSGSDIR